MSETRGVARGIIPVALMLVVLLVACRQPAPKCPANAAGGAAPASPTSPASPADSATTAEKSPYGEIWIGNRINVDGIATFDPQVVREFFDVPSSYVIEGWDVWPWASHAQRTAYWASEAEFEQDLAAQHGSFPGVQAIMYDPEAWPATPFDEQQNPAAAMQKFAAIGHRLGLPVIITPGLTLPQVNGATCTQNAGESIYKAYLRCGIAKSAAENADIVEVQSQTLQGDPDRYVAFTKRAAAQVRETNPAVHVVSGFRVRSQESLDEVKRTWAASVGIVDGHYLAMSPADAAGLLQFIGQCDAQSPAPA